MLLNDSTADCCLLWPPVIATSQPAIVEAQVGCSVHGVVKQGHGLVCREALVALTAVGTCGQRMTSVHVSERGALDMSVRMRLQQDHCGVLFITMQDPSQGTVQATAPLPVLPSVACQELQELMWAMMSETLPAEDNKPAFELDAFSTPFSYVPYKWQGAMRWAWMHHFKPLALDLKYCLENVPSVTSSGHHNEMIVHDYYAVLVPLVAFLKNHDCCATLGALLSHCLNHGLNTLDPQMPMYIPSPVSPPCSAQRLLALRTTSSDCIEDVKQLPGTLVQQDECTTQVVGIMPDVRSNTCPSVNVQPQARCSILNRFKPNQLLLLLVMSLLGYIMLMGMTSVTINNHAASGPCLVSSKHVCLAPSPGAAQWGTGLSLLALLSACGAKRLTQHTDQPRVSAASTTSRKLIPMVLTLINYPVLAAAFLMAAGILGFLSLATACRAMTVLVSISWILQHVF